MANESVIIVQVLTGSFDYQQARKYWKVLKGRLIKEGNETVTNCYQLKLPSSDGKKYMTDVADLQGIFRIIQSDINIILLPLRKHFVSLRLPKTCFPAIELTRLLFNAGKEIRHPSKQANGSVKKSKMVELMS